jgi:hypothetical protein
VHGARGVADEAVQRQGQEHVWVAYAIRTVEERPPSQGRRAVSATGITLRHQSRFVRHPPLALEELVRRAQPARAGPVRRGGQR